MNFLNHSEDEITEINITPLVDIVFLLLIFFMVSTTFVDSQGINVKLPKSSASAAAQVKKDFIVTITQGGKIFVGEKELTLSELRTKLEVEKQAKSSDVTLVVRADGGTRHRMVVDVLDLGQVLGIEQIAIATDPKAE